jgi:FtsP/CotA-like multicopper oxidase with cupredoxin domain
MLLRYPVSGAAEVALMAPDTRPATSDAVGSSGERSGNIGTARDEVGASSGPTRRSVLRAGAGLGLFFVTSVGGRGYVIEADAATLPAVVHRPTLAPAHIPKFVSPLLVPPVMPRSRSGREGVDADVDYYEISLAQFAQQVLPAGMPSTTVWGYGPVSAAAPHGAVGHSAPSPTIEARSHRPVRVRWVNDLKRADGSFLPHLLAVDPTLHWANPPGGPEGRDREPHLVKTPGPYRGPVPMVTHVHGAVAVGDESDGYAEAWYLPAAKNVPARYATEGTWYDFFRAKAARRFDVHWRRGEAIFQYPNTQRACTLWYHDHTLGMTRLNVYAGPAGFFLIRGGPQGDEAVRDRRTGRRAKFPGPAPKEGDGSSRTRRDREIPIAIQDRSFNSDGSLFYPDSRRFFDGIRGPYDPKTDVPPIWNPEFFGNAIMVNGRTWPHLTVEQRRYRLRLLNGCDSRFLILDFSAVPGVDVWQVGNEGGFLKAPVHVTRAGNRILLAPAERADVIVDFARVPVGGHVLRNVGPDEPFPGGEPGKDFDVADPKSTGQVLQFRVVRATSTDTTTPPGDLLLPTAPSPGGGSVRRLALVELTSAFFKDAPTETHLGTVDAHGKWHDLGWEAKVTENPTPGEPEIWELNNTTVDAHPIHIHATAFQVVERQALHIDRKQRTLRPVGKPRGPEPWERGPKDTVIAYPGEVTRLRVEFARPGRYVWHCHIVEHEDNEMMRPMRIGPPQPGQPEA